MKIVLANGGFDPLHYGHILHLRAAREMGDYLVVALTSDAAMSKEKGEQRPFYPWEHRAELLRELRCVNCVVSSESGVDAILKVMPSLFVKGIDYADGGVSDGVKTVCDSLGIDIEYTRTAKLSASEIARRVRAVG